MPFDTSLLSLDFSHLPRDEKVLVACSGGGDSLALLIALHQAEYSLVVAHINHGTRGAASESDEEFVRSTCKKLSVPCAVARLNLSDKPNEATMRSARYEALQTLAREYSCPRIATGHTARDILETVLLNWLRGASVTGFSGIAPLRVLERGVLLVRPMLAVSPEGARAFLTHHNWSWREDASNNSSEYLRNRVRNELLPVLGSLMESGGIERLAQQSARAALIWRDDLEVLEAAAAAALNILEISRDKELLILDGVQLQVLSVGLQRRVLRQAAQQVSAAARDVEFEHIEAVRRHVAQNRRRAVWQWRKELRVEWTGAQSGNRIRFSRV